jgi:hypothetical protein
MRSILECKPCCIHFRMKTNHFGSGKGIDHGFDIPIISNVTIELGYSHVS